MVLACSIVYSRVSNHAANSGVAEYCWQVAILLRLGEPPMSTTTLGALDSRLHTLQQALAQLQPGACSAM